MTVILNLPMPPSTNRLWRVSGRRVHRSARYTAWQKAAGWELLTQRPSHMPTGAAIGLTIRAGKPDRRRRDGDNLGKALCDLLEAHRVIANDADVTDLRIVWDASITPGRVQVEIRDIAQRAA